ncbi:MAG: M48 family metalloprotease [Thermoanaerobaculia bacterium]|nr:M48 family metalloprotease [Thermoanaerobaculia bacterium]
MFIPIPARRGRLGGCARCPVPELAVLVLAIAISGCASNPATGKSQLNFYSEAREIEMGREADREISAQMRVVDDPVLQAYVSEVGLRLAAKSERPHLPWAFKVMDDPAVNAFALPGGFIYVTRGILGHLSSEAELAGVLGHEIGHVTAQHSVNQMSKQQLAQGGLLLGMIVAPEVAQAADLATVGLGALFLKYGRDDERQADDLGLRYMSGTGFEVRELPKVFALLGKVGAAEGGGRVPNWLSSHPDPGDREARSMALIAERAYPSGEVAGQSYLQRMDGLPFGPDPRLGFFEQGVFYHPQLAFEVRLPEGWKSANESSRIVALHPDKIAMVELRVAEGATAAEAAGSFAAKQGIAVTARDSARPHGLTAERIDFAVTRSQGGSLPGRAHFVELGGKVFALYGLAVAERWPEVAGAIDATLTSFAPLRDAARLAARPQEIELVLLPAAMSFDEFLARYPSAAPAATVALVNAVEDRSRTLPAGSLWKRIVGRRHGDVP